MSGILVVAQMGGPTAVINASLAGVVQEAHRQAAITAVFGARQGLEGVLEGNYVDLNQATPARLAQLANTPAAALGSSRVQITASAIDRLLSRFQSQSVRYLALIGGNGTMGVGHRLAQAAQERDYPLGIMGIPKTIDNDLCGTDHAPGYGSAARFLALATRDTGLDLEAMRTFDDVSILEVMGRNTGWLAAATALGKTRADEAPHLVYVPERAFDQEQFLEDVRHVHSRHQHVFVVASEGIRDADGRFVGEETLAGHKDAMGRLVHSLSHGVASYLSDLVVRELGLQSRFLRPGLIGRASSACASSVDRDEALLVGAEAARQLAAGESGSMIALAREPGAGYRCRTRLVPLAEVAGKERPLPPDFINNRGNGPTTSFVAYARPLIGQPLTPVTRLNRTITSLSDTHLA